MSNERTFYQAIGDMTDDPERRYSYDGYTYRVEDGALCYLDPDTDAWTKSGLSNSRVAQDGRWYLLLSEKERLAISPCRPIAYSGDTKEHTMSNERTFSQAIEEMTADPERRYSCGGNTYRVEEGTLYYFRPDATRWFISHLHKEAGNEDAWYRLLSQKEKDGMWRQLTQKERDESFAKFCAAFSGTRKRLEEAREGYTYRVGGVHGTKSAMQEALNTCSRETPPARAEQNPNPKKAYGATKPDMALIPPVAELHMASALEVGDAKYGAYNWRQNPVEAMTYIAAARRHLANYLDGEDISSDGVHNLGQVMACCAILLDSESLGILIDNRPSKGKSSQVQDEMQAKKRAKGRRAACGPVNVDADGREVAP